MLLRILPLCESCRKSANRDAAQLCRLNLRHAFACGRCGPRDSFQRTRKEWLRLRKARRPSARSPCGAIPAEGGLGKIKARSLP